MPKDYVAKQFDFKGLHCAGWVAPMRQSRLKSLPEELQI